MRQAFRPIISNAWDEIILSRHSGTWDEIPNALRHKAFRPLGVTHRGDLWALFRPISAHAWDEIAEIGTK